MKKISEFFLSENVQILEIKFSIYLNRRVFRARSVYLTSHLLGRLSPLSGEPVLCILFLQKLTTALLESAEGRE